MARNDQRQQQQQRYFDVVTNDGSMARPNLSSNNSKHVEGGYFKDIDDSVYNSFSNGAVAMPNTVSTNRYFSLPLPDNMIIGSSSASMEKTTEEVKLPAQSTAINEVVSTGQLLPNSMLKQDDTSARVVPNSTSECNKHMAVQYSEQKDSFVTPNVHAFVPLHAPLPVRHPRFLVEHQSPPYHNISPATQLLSLRSHESKIHPIDVPYDKPTKLLDHNMLSHLSTLQTENAAELHGALLGAHEARKAKELPISHARSEVLSLLGTARDKEQEYATNKHILFRKFVQKMTMAASCEDLDGTKERMQREATELLKIATKVSLRETDYRGAIEKYRDQLLELDNDSILTAKSFADTMYEKVSNAIRTDKIVGTSPGVNDIQGQLGDKVSSKAIHGRRGNKTSRTLPGNTNDNVEHLPKPTSKQVVTKQKQRVADVTKNSEETSINADTRKNAEDSFAISSTDQAHQSQPNKKYKNKGKRAPKSTRSDGTTLMFVPSNIG